MTIRRKKIVVPLTEEEEQLLKRRADYNDRFEWQEAAVIMRRALKEWERTHKEK